MWRSLTKPGTSRATHFSVIRLEHNRTGDWISFTKINFLTFRWIKPLYFHRESFKLGEKCLKFLNVTWIRGPANSWLWKNLDECWTNVILSCKPSDFKWQVHSQKWHSGSQWYITLKEILCGLSWYQKLNLENLTLATGFAGECHIWSADMVHCSKFEFWYGKITSCYLVIINMADRWTRRQADIGQSETWFIT